MACVGLASLKATMEFEIQQPSPGVPPEDLEQMKHLVVNLATLQAFLNKYHIRAQEKPEIKEVEVKIKRFALLAEDKIEVQLRNILLLAEDPKRKKEAPTELHRSLGEIKTQLDELLQIVDKHDDSSELPPHHDNNIPSQLTQRGEEEMVGHSQELKDIIDQLKSKHEERQVISITGMGGIGKSTLAKTVYNDARVTGHFDPRAWTTVSQQHQVKHIIPSLFRQITDDKTAAGELNEAEMEELADKLQKLLKGKRYLIWLDDVWSAEDWDKIQQCFPKDSGCILLTTRDKSVARYTATSDKHFYDLQLLKEEDSRELFCRHPVIKNRMASSDFEEVGKEIVSKCKGLPLTIVVVAGILSDKESVDDWKNIKNELASILTINDQCTEIPALSYKHLPPHLKPCFLHLGVFPEDSEMPVKKLVRLWIAEGFVEVNCGRRLDDVALEYLQALVSRSVVLVTNWGSNGKMKTCGMHDLIHEFCVKEAEKENLLYAGSLRIRGEEKVGNDGINGKEEEGFRWLSFWPNYGNVYFCYNLDKSRSLSILHRNTIPTFTGQYLPSTLLRVLDLIQLPPLSNGILKSLRELVLLRYMDVTLDDHLSPQDLTNIASKAQNLQTLIVSMNKSSSFSSDDVRLPSKIWESLQLRHVEVSSSLLVYPPGKVEKDLHTLYWLSLDHCTRKVLLRIPNVKKLGIICGGEKVVESYNLCYLGRLRVLETLMIAFRKGSPWGFRNLNFLQPHLNIKKLKLKRTRLAWSEINVIGMLPNLEVLKLKEASDDTEWEPSSQGLYSKLKSLYLEAKNLVSWEINEEGQFPCLECVILKRCTRLEAIPSGFEDTLALKLIVLKNCSPSVSESVNAINESLLELGHEPIAIR